LLKSEPDTIPQKKKAIKRLTNQKKEKDKEKEEARSKDRFKFARSPNLV